MMIRIGLKDNEKSLLIETYLYQNPLITDVIVFSPDSFKLPCDYEQYSWDDIIMYKVFYPLLERINDNYLIVVNELLRTAKRNDLTYNCLHHYLNQTKHKIIFQWFPIIDNINDFMILADNEYSGRYKGRSFATNIFEDLDFKYIDRRPQIHIINIDVPDKALIAYEQERDKLFDTLGNKDPDTIPRHLHLWAGKWKKSYITAYEKYLARNQRFKLPNIATYKNAVDADRISIDLPHRRIELNDYLYRTHSDKVEFLSTPLKVDKYYANELINWDKMVGDFYAKTSVRI